MNVEVDASDPGDVWANKDEVARAEWEARQFWAALPDERRAGVGLLVHDALIKLLVDQARWLPEACSRPHATSTRVDVTISFLLPEVDTAALTARVLRERVKVKHGTALLEMERKLRS